LSYRAAANTESHTANLRAPTNTSSEKTTAINLQPVTSNQPSGLPALTKAHGSCYRLAATNVTSFGIDCAVTWKEVH